jgi:uncharacterized protein YndB with AHSA1/START domain
MSTDTLGVGYVLTLERRFAAPRELVFDCFTKAEHLQRWWGPRCFTSPECESDARPGGALKLDMHGPEPYGFNPVRGEFLEVERPDRLVFVLRAFPGDDDSWGVEHVTTLIFEETPDGNTLMHMTTRVLKVSDELLPSLAGMRQGWSESLDKLEELLPALR